MHRHLDPTVESLLHAPGPVVVSVSLPTTPHRAGNRDDVARLRLCIEHAEEQLRDRNVPWNRDAGRAVASRLGAAAAEIDLRHPGTGVLLWAGPTWHRAMRVPFEVDERVTISDRAVLRPLVTGLATTPRFRVLVLAEHSVHLFEGAAGALREVHGDGFPLRATIVPVSDPRHSDLPIRDTRVEARRTLLREVDTLLAPLLREDPTPLVLAAPPRDRAAFRAVTMHSALLDGEVGGWNTEAPLGMLLESLADVDDAIVATHQRVLLAELDRAIGAKRAALGLEESLGCALDGNGRILLVEPDAGPESPVERAVVAVLDKGGIVEPVPTGALPGTGGIALLLRH